MNLEIDADNHLTFEIVNLENLDIYKIFLLLKNNSSINMFFEEIDRDLKNNIVKFNISIKNDKILSQLNKLYLVIFHSNNIYEEIFLDDVSLISNSPVNLISIPSNKRNINLKEKTYEVEIPLENIFFHKNNSN